MNISIIRNSNIKSTGGSSLLQFIRTHLYMSEGVRASVSRGEYTAWMVTLTTDWNG